MASIWTVKPETVRVELAWTDDDGASHPMWVKLKKQLTVGESRRVMTAGWRGMSSRPAGAADGGTKIDIDWQAQSFARAETYVVEWSLEDDEGRRLPISREVLESLRQDVFNLVEAAINDHIGAVGQEKKATGGDAPPVATSA